MEGQKLSSMVRELCLDKVDGFDSKIKYCYAIFPTTKGECAKQSSIQFFFCLLIMMTLLTSTTNVLLVGSQPDN